MIGSKCRRTSSGSSFSIKLVDPRMSAKSTVTCLRSPSINLREARIFSAKYLGTMAFTGPGWLEAAPAGAGGSASRWPQVLQNFAPGRFALLQCGQSVSSGAPHSSQNPESGEFSVWQREQIMRRVHEARRFDTRAGSPMWFEQHILSRHRESK